MYLLWNCIVLYFQSEHPSLAPTATSSKVKNVLWCLTVGVLRLSALNTDLSDGADDGAVRAVFAHQIDDAVRDFFNSNPAVDAILSHMLQNTIFPFKHNPGAAVIKLKYN